MKLNILYQEYKNTEVIKGSPVLFFWLFWCTKFLSNVQRRSTWLDKIIHKLFAAVPQPEFVIKNHGGIFVVKPFDDSTTICADYFERDIRDWLLTPSVKNIFVDIGANRGIYSIIAPTKYGYQTVHALEPNKDMFDVLKRNIDLNHLSTTVSCHFVAAGKESGVAEFTVDPMHKGGGRIVSEKNAETFTVSVQALDLILKDVAFQHISFIKIDTEGFEFEVLAGMPGVLAGMLPGSCLMIETIEIENLTALLAPFGFTRLKSENQDHLFMKQV